MKKIFALVFSLIILEQNSFASNYSYFDDEYDDDYSLSSRKTSSWDDDGDDYSSSSRKTSSWDDDGDDYSSSSRETSSWDDDDDDYRSSFRRTSSWNDDDDYSYRARYNYYSEYDDDDEYLINPRSEEEQREIDKKREQRKKEKQLRKKQGKQKRREKALTNRRDQAAIDRIILDETPEDEKFDLLKDQLKLANTRMEKYISKLKKKFTDSNLDFIERSFKFNNNSIAVLLENSRPDAKWKGKFLKENSEFAENDDEQITNKVSATSEQSTDGSQEDPEQITDENIEKINGMTREECQQKVKDGLIDKEHFFLLSLNNEKRINKAVKSIIKAVENQNGKTSQINKRKDMGNAPKLRLLVSRNSNLFKDVEFVKSIKNQLKVLSESIRESYETASENSKKDHPYLKFLIVDKI